MAIGHRISLLERVSEWLVNDVNAPPDCHDFEEFDS